MILLMRSLWLEYIATNKNDFHNSDFHSFLLLKDQTNHYHIRYAIHKNLDQYVYTSIPDICQNRTSPFHSFLFQQDRGQEPCTSTNALQWTNRISLNLQLLMNSIKVYLQTTQMGSMEKLEPRNYSSLL